MSIAINICQSHMATIKDMNQAVITAKCPECGLLVRVKPDENGFYFGHCPHCGLEIES